MQPMMDTQPSAEEIIALIAPLKGRPGALLVVLHAIQDSIGFIPASAVPVVAAELNLSRAEVHGVIGFYHYFRDRPSGARVVQICRAESCQAMHGERLAEHAVKRLGIDFGATTADGRTSLEAVYCLGLCSLSPAAMIDGEVHGRLSPERFDELLTGQKA